MLDLGQEYFDLIGDYVTREFALFRFEILKSFYRITHH